MHQPADSLVKTSVLAATSVGRRSWSVFHQLIPGRLASQINSKPTLPSAAFNHLSRFYSSSSSRTTAATPEWASSEAKAAAHGLLDRWGARQPGASRPHLYSDDSKTAYAPATDFRQTLDANQLMLLRVTLGEMIPLNDELLDARKQTSASSSATPAHKSISYDPPTLPVGTPLLPGEHLIYFTPRTPLSTLGHDGSDTTFNPPGDVFVRRMWAGGSMEWDSSSAPSLLRIGEEVRERTWIESAEVKRLSGGAGGEMILVWVRKEYVTPSGQVPLVDRRSWVFQRRLQASSSSASAPAVNSESGASIAAAPTPFLSRSTPTSTTLVQTPASLFRFSALTYNAHAIHLSPPWARTREGHEDIVVHGPLNLSLILRQWYATHGSTRRLVRVEYRAKRPLYVGEEHDVVLRELETGSHEVRVLKGSERDVVVMVAKLTSTAL